MPDGLVFYLAVLFSEQLALLLFPVEGDAFAQPQDGQRRRDVARHDAMHDPGREHREAQRPRDAGAIVSICKLQSHPLQASEPPRNLQA